MERYEMGKIVCGKLRTVFVLLAFVLVSGCLPVKVVSNMSAKFERVEEVRTALEGGSLLVAETHNGGIEATGGEGKDCVVTAKIEARAGTVQEAEDLAQKVKLGFESSNKTVILKIEKPPLGSNQQVTVSLKMTVPRPTKLKLTSYNGSIAVSGMTDAVNAETHNGGIAVEQISADVALRTYNGTVTCQAISGSVDAAGHNGMIRISFPNDAPAKTCKVETYNAPIFCEGVPGDLVAKSHNGSITAACSNQPAGPRTVTIITYNGDIDFTPPRDFSAQVDLSTHNGTINTTLPISVKGKIGKRLQGTVGSGEGTLRLETHNGSITIR